MPFFSEKLVYEESYIPQSLTLQFAVNHPLVTYRCFTLPWDVRFYFMFPEMLECKRKLESYIVSLMFQLYHSLRLWECSRLITAKIVYNITDRESFIASRWHKFQTKRFKCYLLSCQQKLSKMWRSSSHGKLISYS